MECRVMERSGLEPNRDRDGFMHVVPMRLDEHVLRVSLDGIIHHDSPGVYTNC